MNDIIAKKVIELAAEQVNLPANEVLPDHHFINDLNFDSLDVVEFCMNLEEYFNVTVSDETMQTLDTVAKAIDYVEKNANEAPAL